MTLTLSNIIGLAIIGIVGIIITILIAVLIACDEGNIAFALIPLALTIIIFVGTALFDNWANTSTASGIRRYKDYQSELSNGIEREITITAEDGREIFHYEGKVDVESNHTDNYIKFESEDGKRYIIYYGIQDTITIIEK